MRPDVAADVGQVPPADGFELGLAVDERVDAFEPFGLARLTPRTVPAGGGCFWPHAARVRAIGRCRGDLRDMDRFLERAETIEHPFDFQQVNLWVIELQ